MMLLSNRGVRRLAGEEWNGKNGLRADGRYYVYLDYKGIPTIGIGHAVRHGEDWSKGLTLEQVLELFHKDLASSYHAIQTGVRFDYNQAQFDSMVVTGHNLGVGFFDEHHSHPIAALNAGDLEGYCSASCDGHCLSRGKQAHLQDWNRSGEPPIFDPNLFARRKREREWFFEAPPADDHPLFSDDETREIMNLVAVTLSQSLDQALADDRHPTDPYELGAQERPTDPDLSGHGDPDQGNS